MKSYLAKRTQIYLLLEDVSSFYKNFSLCIDLATVSINSRQNYVSLISENHMRSLSLFPSDYKDILLFANNLYSSTNEVFIIFVHFFNGKETDSLQNFKDSCVKDNNPSLAYLLQLFSYFFIL